MEGRGGGGDGGERESERERDYKNNLPSVCGLLGVGHLLKQQEYIVGDSAKHHKNYLLHPSCQRLSGFTVYWLMSNPTIR